MKNLEQAKIARKKAYVPYSHFKVGAAIELKDGTFIHGANIENASYPLSNCAERSALFSLLSQGYSKEDIKSMTIVADSKHPISPCGACRQVMHELMPKGTPIYLTNLEGEIKETNPDDLLPYAFEEFKGDKDA
jgi:cytidine deaminase